MYPELILALAAENEWVHVRPPCPESAIAAAEQAVGYPFPAELRDLLREMDGDRWLLLSAAEIAENAARNRAAADCYAEAGISAAAYEDRVIRFLFFATNGCGDYYGYRISSGGVLDDSVIYRWEHEQIGASCCWVPVAKSIKELIARYYRDEI